MYQFKDAVRRSVALSGAAAMLAGVIATAIPGVAFADALNPLTERSLLLTSSSPGYHYLDGSGNTTYAPPGSGPNGKKTGETFDFKVSTNSSVTGTNTPIKAFTFQYCTGAAGLCKAPGNDPNNDNGTAGDDSDDFHDADDATHSDLSINYTSPVQDTDFEIWVGGVQDTSGDWDMVTANKEDYDHGHTGKVNFITLTNSTNSAPIKPTAGTEIKVIFKASSGNYITNPGAGAFFVKLNTFDSDTLTDPLVDTSHIIDGGVTVANVMTDSIQIQTKVLETMSFSVGTTNPDTAAISHGPCDAITVNNPIKLGDPAAEYSLAPQTAYDGYSYFRLGSNSSGGATVYYSGATLSNTVGDQIDEVGNTSDTSHTGMEQFGLGIDSTADTLDSAFSTLVTNSPLIYQNPHLTPLVAYNSGGLDYGNADGTINGGSPTAEFAFSPTALSTPVVIASENTDVLHCSTGKVRYLANIAPDTPAGVYTTAINYLAAPQY